MIRLVLAVLSLGLAAGAAQAQEQEPAPEEDPLTRAERYRAAAGRPMASAELVAQIAMHAASEPLGSVRNPVRANMPRGQRAYLARLRCSDGQAPGFERVGSSGGSIYGNIQDLYTVDCGDAEPGRVEVHIDMYHRHVELAPVPGFTIVAPQ